MMSGKKRIFIAASDERNENSNSHFVGAKTQGARVIAASDERNENSNSHFVGAKTQGARVIAASDERNAPAVGGIHFVGAKTQGARVITASDERNARTRAFRQRDAATKIRTVNLRRTTMRVKQVPTVSRGKVLRIFIAIPFSKSTRMKIAAFAKKHRALPVRWLSSKNLHITLIPPWYEDDFLRVKRIMKRIAGAHGPIELSFRVVTFGPDPKRPRLIWAEGTAPRKLLEVKETLNNLFGIKNEYRPWKLHATLARFNPDDFSSFPVKRFTKRILWKETADSLVVMESRLSRLGAEYKIIYTVPL